MTKPDKTGQERATEARTEAQEGGAEAHGPGGKPRSEYPAPEGVPVVPEDPKEPAAPTVRHLEAERNTEPTLAERNAKPAEDA